MIGRRIEVDHRDDGLDVDATGRHVSCNQRLGTTRGELAKCAVALVLRAAAVQGYYDNIEA